MGRLTFLLALGAILPASDAEAPKRKYDVDSTMTVTAEAEPVELVKTPNPVVVVDAKTLDRLSANSASDLLQSTFPGQVLSNGGVGTSASFFFGGARNQDVVVTLNGIRIQNPMGTSGVSLNTIGLASVDRLEIQQGSHSPRQGANALGGVVSLQSAGSAPDGLTGLVRLGVGSHQIRRAALAPAYGWGTGWFRVGVDTRQEDQSIPTANHYRSVDSFIGLGQQIGEASLLTADYVNTYVATPIPFDSWGYATNPRPSSDFKERRETNARSKIFSTSLRTQYSSTLSSEFTLGGWEQDQMNPVPGDPVGLPTTRYAGRGSQFTEVFTWSPAPSISLAGTLDLAKNRGTSPDYSTPSIVNVGKGWHAAYSLEGSLEPIHQLRITGAVREQKDHLEIQPGDGTTPNSRYSSATTYKLGVNLLLPNGFRVYASGGTSYAHPMLYQMLYNLANSGPSLQNEKSYTLQTGSTWERSGWKARLALSRSVFDRLIFWNPNLGKPLPPPWGMTGAYQSGSNVRIQSAEFGLGHHNSLWGLEGFYRNQEARDLSQPKAQQLSAPSVVRRPFQSLGLNAYWVRGKLRLDAKWSWFGSRYEYGLPFAYKAHFNDLNIAATYNLRENLTLALRGDHLLQPTLSKEEWLSRKYDLDNDISMIYGFPAQPPTWTLEARYRF